MAIKQVKESSKTDFSKITISLSSPEAIIKRSRGEVTKPETINYRSLKPEKDGLFCERIFGPTKDWQCSCGKYKRIRYKGTICDNCGVEVTEKKVRRERSGHIKLNVPITHTWYFRAQGNVIGTLIGVPYKKLIGVIYFERYIVIRQGAAQGLKVQYLEQLSEEEYFKILSTLPAGNQELDDNDPDKFIAKMGSEAIHDLLSTLDLDALSYELRDSVSKETSQQRKKEQIKRLKVIEAFKEANLKLENRPEWMVLKVLPVIPPDLRPLVALDGSRFAASDINELYRQVIQRNNRLKQLMDQRAPEVILRNEKRMLQEAVDTLLDNTKKTSATRGDSNRPSKSLSDNLDGKQGRFRQNLLGKRVDFSGRSVIVVGPELKISECGLPKDMAAELYKPFIIRKLLERGICKNVKDAKRKVEKKEAVVWDVLENIMKGHPVMLNRAPTLHRLGIQAFQPKMIEGKAIRLHPLVCTAFNADFDGDQMAVHLPLSNAAILEAQLLMLASHNILNPANGSPVTVPSQDMVLGLYYLTKGKKSTETEKVKGEGQTFYGPEEVIIAFNEKRVDMHAIVNVRIEKPEGGSEILKTTVGRVLFNQVVPKSYGYVNIMLTKKTLRNIITDILYKLGNAATAEFLDNIKNLGYQTAFKGGLSFNLSDVIVPEIKKDIIAEANARVDEIVGNYSLGVLTDNERYNQIIDGWKETTRKLSDEVVDVLKNDKQGFNPVYMMLDSGARGSKDQIRQLCGIRGLMNKPQKSGDKSSRVTIENPIVASFKEGLSVLEYFISTHGARKGLADTALKTADAGYLTRRLVDVAHDVIISEADCGTMRGLEIHISRNFDESKRSAFIFRKLLGRVVVNDVVNPDTLEVIIEQGEELTEEKCQQLVAAPIFDVEIRSVLTCDSKRGVCSKCYGRNLATGKLVQRGEAVGVIAAQSIGEPGTQLTLRTFHEGGVAGAGKDEAGKIIAKHSGILELNELRSVDYKDKDKNNVKVVIGRSAEMRILDPNTKVALFIANLPYGATLRFAEGDKVKQGDLIADWDAYNAVMISEVSGVSNFHNIIENVTFRVEKDEATGLEEKTIIDTKMKSKNPAVMIIDNSGELVKQYDTPVGAVLAVEDKQKIKAGDVLVKIPRNTIKAGDITGGLPRVQELFEARNASDKAVVAEIDGFVRFGTPKKVGDKYVFVSSTKLNRGNKEITIESRSGEFRTYRISATKQILAQENDFVKAGTTLSEGQITPQDILAIQGPTKVQEYIVGQIQGVYEAQDVVINDKHFEVIVRQMMRKVEIVESGDTTFLESEIVSKIEFKEENDKIFGKKVVVDAGASEIYKVGQIISAREQRDENMMLKQQDKKLISVRDTVNATAKQILQSITQSALQSEGFLSAASFQHTTRVLTEAAIAGKTDHLLGMKANVIIGQHLIPAGTGLKEYRDISVSSKKEVEEVEDFIY